MLRNPPYSERQRAAERAGKPVDLQYDQLPTEFRNQVIYTLGDVIGEVQMRGSTVVGYSGQASPARVWRAINDQVMRTAGLAHLTHPHLGQMSPQGEFSNYLRSEATLVPRLLDAIEIAFATVNRDWPSIQRYQSYDSSRLNANQAVDELNRAFRRHDLGYQFDAQSGMIQRLDSEYLHAEATVPALTLLRDQAFATAEQEFLKAHSHFRHGRYEEAITDAVKSYESTMKLICDARGWAYQQQDTVAPLVRILRAQGLIPESFEGFLTSGPTTIRNRQAAHGQGAQPRQVPAHLAAFALHLARSGGRRTRTAAPRSARPAPAASRCRRARR